MRNRDLLWLGCGILLMLCSACSTPNFHPVAQIPPGRGLIYIYTVSPAGNRGYIIHNSKKLGALGPYCYLIDFPQEGPNSYGVPSNFFTRGGLLGLMVKDQAAEPTIVNVVAGNTYYVKQYGSNPDAELWRVDESDALPELARCHQVKVTP